MQMSISLNNSTVLVLVNGKKFELTRTRTRRFWTLSGHRMRMATCRLHNGDNVATTIAVKHHT